MRGEWMTSYGNGKESSTYSSHILVIIDQFIKYNTRLNGQYHASINGKLRWVMITLTLMDEQLVMCKRCSSVTEGVAHLTLDA